MRRSHHPVTAATLVALLCVALLVSGCSSWFESPAKPANEAIAIANDHLKKAADLQSEIESTVVGLESLPYTQEGAAQGLEATAKLRDTVAEERTELEAARDALGGIAKLDVADDYKEYAALGSKAIETRITLTDTVLRLFDAMDVLYESLQPKGNEVEPDQIQAIIAQVKQELSDLGQQASDEAQAASDFFASKGLGR